MLAIDRNLGTGPSAAWRTLWTLLHSICNTNVRYKEECLVRHRKPVPNKRSTGSWPATYRWLATGTLVVYTAIGCHKVDAAPLHPLRTGAARFAFQAAAALPPQRFDIPAGTIQEAAQVFSKATNLEVGMTNEGIGQLATPGVSGVLTPPQALEQMLKSTGVHFRFTGATSVILELNSVAERVDVSASTTALPTSISK